MVDTKTWLDSSDEAHAVTKRLMREVIDVAQRCGVSLKYELVDELMAKVLTMGRLEVACSRMLKRAGRWRLM
jgi:ketopantoate reductase